METGVDEFAVETFDGEEIKAQHDRAYLRERFLFAMTKLCGRDCAIAMYDNCNVRCRLRAFNPEFQQVIVEKLETSMKLNEEKGILRVGDIRTFSFELNDDENKNWNNK